MTFDPRPLVSSFPDRRVVVVGDLMLDEFVRGDVARVSPEAPVPVLEVRSRSVMPGGAANAAATARALGAAVAVLGVVGADREGDLLRASLAEQGIDAGGVLTDATRPTSHKQRFVARGQQIVRIDHESRAPLDAHAADALATALESALEHADACIISDYAKGVVERPLVARTIAAARARGVAVVIDPKARDFALYAGATVVTPNLAELENATGRACRTTDEVVREGTSLLSLLDGAAVLATRSADGMTLLEPGKAPTHVRATARAVYDVTGAGDTVVGTLALALAAGAPLCDAVRLASSAAAVVVSKVGTATLSARELLAEYDASPP